MITYSSHTRTPSVPVVPGPFDAPPTMMPVGEIVYPDGYRVLVPQPVKFQEWPSSTLADVYVLSGAIPGHEKVISAIDYGYPEAEAYVTLPVGTIGGGLSWTGVMEAISEGPQSHAKGRTWRTGVPVRYIAALFLGMVLIGLSLVAWFVVLPLMGVE